MAEQDEIRTAAVKRLKSQAAFWRLLITFVILWVAMILIWALSSRGYFWPAWVIVGTGVALAFSGFDAFGPRKKGLSQEKIDQEMKKFGSSPGASS
jgi:hypothetical protein